MAWPTRAINCPTGSGTSRDNLPYLGSSPGFSARFTVPTASMTADRIFAIARRDEGDPGGPTLLRSIR